MFAFTLGYSDAAIIALFGYVLVFFGLVLLMLVVMLFGKAFSAKKKAAPTAPAVVAVETQVFVAPGSAGQVRTYNVPPKTCAMLMAIVADKLGKPINELRFISIKEVE